MVDLSSYVPKKKNTEMKVPSQFVYGSCGTWVHVLSHCWANFSALGDSEDCECVLQQGLAFFVGSQSDSVVETEAYTTNSLI